MVIFCFLNVNHQRYWQAKIFNIMNFHFEIWFVNQHSPKNNISLTAVYILCISGLNNLVLKIRLPTHYLYFECISDAYFANNIFQVYLTIYDNMQSVNLPKTCKASYVSYLKIKKRLNLDSNNWFQFFRNITTICKANLRKIHLVYLTRSSLWKSVCCGN